MQSPEILSVQVWILGGSGTVLLGILIYIIKQGLKSFVTGLKNTNGKLEHLTDELHKLNLLLTSHQGDIKSNSDTNAEQHKRLNKQADRLRDLEIEIEKLK